MNGGGEGRTINLVPGPCTYGAGGRGEPRRQPEPLDLSPDGWPGHPRGPPLIDLGGKTENLALLWAPASNQLHRTRPAWLPASSFFILVSGYVRRRRGEGEV